MVRIESKVTAATFGAALAAFTLWVLETYVFKDVVPGPVEGIVLLAVTGLVTFVSGYMAKHTARPDLPMNQR